MQNILYNPDFALTQHHLITILFSFFLEWCIYSCGKLLYRHMHKWHNRA